MITLHSVHDAETFPALRQAVQKHFARMTNAAPALFTTDVEDLYGIFLLTLDPALRREYTCRACRTFVERYGGLVTIDAEGKLLPVCWPEDAEVRWPFVPVTSACRHYVQRAAVTGVWLSALPVWGLPESPPTATGHVWHHMAVDVPQSLRYHHPILTPGQAMAEKREDFRLLSTALGTYPQRLVATAHAFLASEQLYRAEHTLGIATWFLALHDQLAHVKDRWSRAVLVWRAVASAPPGWCHVGSTMIGTLLEDLVAGLDFADCQRKFSAKMHPLQYQRPQAAPSGGTLDRAEKLVAQLGVARSLERRFATLDDVQEFVWRPHAPATKKVLETVFAHLRQKQGSSAPITTGGLTMTWVKFRDKVLPDAEAIACWPPPSGPYAALTTALHADAPPILQWDTEERRNPVAWYFYHGGSQAQHWNLTANIWQPVVGITLQPTMWGEKPERFTHHGHGVFVLLQDAYDVQRQTRTGIALFPETLKNEYREIRAVVEAYSRHGTMPAPEAPYACGLGYKDGQEWGVRLRVTARGVQTVYTLDRWD